MIGPIVIGVLGTITKGFFLNPVRLVNWRRGRDYPNDSIAKNGQNPETTPGDLLSLKLL